MFPSTRPPGVEDTGRRAAAAIAAPSIKFRACQKAHGHYNEKNGGVGALLGAGCVYIVGSFFSVWLFLTRPR